MVHARRVATVTLGLALTGAVAGGGCAAVVAGALLARNFGVASLASADGAAIAGVLALSGAAGGGALVPAFAWLLMRRVPLGFAVIGVALGALVGALVGEYLAPVAPYDGHPVPGFLAGALAGMIVAALTLRVWASRRSRAHSAEAAG